MTKTKIRDASADNAKGLLILLVVVGHVFFINEIAEVVELIYLFHMPAFLGLGLLFVKPISMAYLLDRSARLLLPFIAMLIMGFMLTDLFFVNIPKLIKGQIPTNLISGIWVLLWLGIVGIWLISKSKQRQIIEVVGKIKPLIIWVWVGLGILTYAYFAFKDRELVPLLTDRIIWANWRPLTSVLWFLPALFSLTILGAALKRLSPSVQALVVCIVGAVVWFGLPWLRTNHLNIPWGIDVALVCLPIAYLMQLIYQQRELIKSVVNPAAGWIFFLVCLGLGYWLIPMTKLNGFTHRVDMSQLNLPWLGLPLVILIALSYWVACLHLNKHTWIAYIGTQTLPIFVLHIPLLFALRSITAGLSGYPYIQFGIIVTTCVGVPLIIAYILGSLDKRFSYLGLA